MAAIAERRRTRIPASITRDQWDEAAVEIQVLRDELRTLGRLSPHASRVHAYVLGVAESVEVVNLSAAVAAYLARAARRHP